jgi:quercetin dioxygenase-like cupin family protein
MKTPANRIARGSEFTPDIEGHVFDGADGSQVAFWTARADRTSSEHAHAFDEYVLVVEGRATLIADGSVTVLEAGDEATIPKGTTQRMVVVAGTRTIHVFGGRRARREVDGERT